MKIVITCIAYLSWAAAFAQPDAFVVNNLAETLSRINLETGQVQNHVTTLGDTPNQIAYHDGFLYVVNSISANLQRIDPQTNMVTLDIPLPIGSNPYNMDFDSNYAYISCLVSGDLIRINLTTGQPQGAVNLGGYPEGVLVHGNRIYVSQTGFNPSDFSYGQGQIAVIDQGNFTLIREVNVGKNPQFIFSAPDSNLHAVCTGNYVDVSGTIYIYDPSLETVTDSILIGGQPGYAVVSRQGIAYVAAGGWIDHGNIFSYNAITYEILRGSANPILTGLGTYSLALDSLGFLYSCDFGSDTVTKLSGAGQILETYSLGDGPQSIAIIDNRVSGIDDNEFGDLPGKFNLLCNYPNPFNGQTVIKYSIDDDKGPLDIFIYDISGRLIRALGLGTNLNNGSVIWDGRENGGQMCSSGLYFAKIQARKVGAVGNTLKITLIK